MMGIKVNKTKCPPQVSCFDLSGKIYHENVNEMEKTLNKAIRNGTKNIVINCEDLTIIDSSGLSVFVDVIKKLSKRSGSLQLCAMNESVKKIFKLTNLEKFIEIYPDLETAIEELKD